MGEVISTIPTIGFNVETVTYKNIKFQVWDLGGQTSIRPYWRCYYPNTQVRRAAAPSLAGVPVTRALSSPSAACSCSILPAWRRSQAAAISANTTAHTQAVIYVVDSSDVDRLGTSREEFHAILDEEELKNALVLVYANKQDVPGALTEAQVAEGLGLHDIKSRDWAIFKASAVKGVGLFEGLDWLSNMLKTRR